MHAMLRALLDGAGDDAIIGVEVVAVPALSASAADVLAADAIVLGTPVNIGYMSGALKHFFDVVYYPCLDATRGLPYGVYLHGNEGLEGGVNSVTSIARALGWVPVAAPVEVLGTPDAGGLAQVRELGAVAAATIMAG